MNRIVIALALFTAATAGAEPTNLTIRAVSRDAKILGDLVGGARITIRDTATGSVLASGLQTGSSGDTKWIMQEPRVRGARVYDTEGAAAFRVALDLNKPTQVEIVAEGPLKYPQAMQRATRTMLLLPGAHVEGEGILLEIPGFIVDAAPATFEADAPIVVSAKVTMSCGCPTEPRGIWDAGRIAVTARLFREGTLVRELPLDYAGTTSTYEGTVDPLDPGSYAVEIIASDAREGNFGRAVTRLTVAPAAE